MKLLIWAIFVQITWNNGLGYIYEYYDTNMHEFKPPRVLKDGEYFGYSVAYYPFTKKLIISAPAADQGLLFECDMTTAHCTQLFPFVQNYTFPTFGRNHGFWYGASVATSENFMIACAPRRVRVHDEVQTPDHIGSFGKCFVRDGARPVLSSFLQPTGVQSVNTVKNNTAEVFGDSFGWSVHISPSNPHSILVGGPAKHTGRVTRYETKQDKFPIILIRYRSDRAKLNFGYSVTTGYFVHKNILSYVSGSPYGVIGAGRVYFYQTTKKHGTIEGELQDKRKGGFIEGPLGSRFGAVLCTAQLTGPESDLLVGAPSFAEGQASDRGAVYVYVPKYDGKLPELRRVIKGQIEGAGFGSAIISVGDLNLDGKDEIAIAAPFEGNGAVYLYSGLDLIKMTQSITPLQKIQSSKYRSFGLSLAAVSDGHESGCSELAVSAPFDNIVVLLRCNSAITVTLSANFSTVQDRSPTTNTDYTFDVCLSIKYPDNPKVVKADMLTEIRLNHRSAKLTKSDDDGVFRFITPLNIYSGTSQFCKHVKYYLPLAGRYTEPITYKVTTKVHSSDARVVLTDQSNLHVQDTVWAVNCTAGSCEPIVNLTIVHGIKSPYIIGSTTSESIEVKLYNNGYASYYGGIVRVRLFAPLVVMPPACMTADNDINTIECYPNKPLDPSETWSTGMISVDMTQLTNRDHFITMEAWLSERSTSSVPLEPSTITIPLETDSSGVGVKGTNSLGSYVSITTAEFKGAGKQMEHTYTVINNGKVNWEGLKCELKLKKNPYLLNDTMHEQFGLTCDTYETDEYIHTNCSDISLKIGRSLDLIIPLQVAGINNETFEGNFTIDSNFTILMDETPITESVVTVIQVADPTVALWIIISAGVGGLLLLAIIIVILYKCGFLKRKHKQKLEVQKESIKRQSMMGDSRPRSVINSVQKQENVTNSCAELLQD